VIPPAKTGRDKSNKIAVIKTDQTNKGIILIAIFLLRIFRIVEIKFTAPKIEDTPAKCKEKIALSTDIPL